MTKKILFLIVFLCKTTFLLAQSDVVYIPDANFKSYLVENLSININEDEEIQVEEAEKFTGDINCSWKSIRDLAGIEAFVNIKLLNCERNSLKSIDLTENKLLESLYCGWNSIESLSVTHLSNLRKLSCHFNPLGVLDVSSNYLLEDLSCSGSDLLSLNVSNNLELTSLICYSNGFETLDLSNNNKIKIIDCSENSINELIFAEDSFLEDLNCDVNKLSSLNLFDLKYLKNLSCLYNLLPSIDVSQCVNLEKLNCYWNRITNLDISENTKLKEVLIHRNGLNSLNIEGLKSLEVLDCSQNNLTTLNVSQDENLKTLLCYDNFITEIDLSNNLQLNSVYCYDNQLVKLDVKNGNNIILEELLSYGNPNLECIKIDDLSFSRPYCNSDENGWCKDNTALYSEVDCEDLDCSIVTIPDVNFKEALLNRSEINANRDDEIQLCEAESYDGAIFTSSRDVEDLTGIESFKNITTLYCNSNKLSTINLSKNLNLGRLYASDNLFTSIDLSENTKLISLTISDNQLESLDFSNNESLVFLTVNDNNLKSIDVSKNTKLSRINCDNNNLEFLDLSNNPTLDYVSCQFNSELISLDLRNSNNRKLYDVNASDNIKLNCINVDNYVIRNYEGNTWGYLFEWWKDDHTILSEDCNIATASIIDEIFSSNIVIYPNPTSDFITIESGVDFSVSSYQIFDFLGKEMLRQNSSKIDISNFPKGIYLLKLVNVNGGIGVKKIIKE